jgi:hypothetical protein
VCERNRLWSADGTWEYLLQQIQAAADADGEVGWDISADSTTVPISTPPAPVSRRPHRLQWDAGSELTGEAARLSLCDHLAEMVQAPEGPAAHAAGSPPGST